MQIKCNNPSTKSVTVTKFGGLRVDFSKTGLATVPDDVGKFLIRRCPAISDNSKTHKPKTTIDVKAKKPAVMAVKPFEAETKDVNTKGVGE